jgi:predicted PurR-regulated permease PerM
LDASSPSRWIRPVVYAVSVLVIFIIATNARPVVLPIVIGIALALISFPLYRWIVDRLGRVVTILLLVLTWVAVFFAVASALVFIGNRVIGHFRERSEEYREQYVELREAITDWGVPGDMIPRAWEPRDEERAEEPPADTAPLLAAETPGLSDERIRSIVSFATSGVGEMLSFLALLGLGIGLGALLLAESGRWDDFARRHTDADRYEALASTTRMSGVDVRRHFGVKTVTGLITGVGTGLTAWAFGLPIPLTWGVLTFLMNYIPNVGALLSAFPPVFIALLLDGPWTAVGLAVTLLIIENSVGTFLEPILEGRALPVSPFFALLSLVLWGYLLGAVGVLLAVPLTAVIVRFGWLFVSPASLAHASQHIVRPNSSGDATDPHHASTR